MERRALLKGLIGLIAAPVIVRASSLMPVRAWIEPEGLTIAKIIEARRILREYEVTKTVINGEEMVTFDIPATATITGWGVVGDRVNLYYRA